MDLAVLHHHLNRGGVTCALVSHLRALDATASGIVKDRVALIYGGRHEGWAGNLPPDSERLDVSAHVVAAIDYDPESAPACEPERLAGGMREALRDAGMEPATTVLHVHNPTLGKNVSLAGALRRLAEAGYGLLLQVHDFAEDFRPANYRRLATALRASSPRELAAELYPQAAHVHYAVLNRRDAALLRGAGVAESRLHLLPDPVLPPGSPASRADARARLSERFGIPAGHRLLLYPVRGIRRKNLGEVLLWSALGGDRTTVGVTLPPLNPVERPSYERWKGVAAELDLPCRFELGAPGGLALSENLAAADLVLTTSLAEGFGLAFLEPWLAGRAVVGRDLPEITPDFVQNGVRLPDLYPRVAVPLDWVDKRALRDDLQRRFREIVADYGAPPLDPAELRRGLDEMLGGGLVDFGVLGSARQREVLGTVRGSRDRAERLLERNPVLRAARSDAWTAGDETIEHNAARIREHYSLERTGERLRRIYRRVAESPRGLRIEPPACGEQILRWFLDPVRFRPVWVEP